MTDKLAYKLVACIPGKVRHAIKIPGLQKRDRNSPYNQANNESPGTYLECFVEAYAKNSNHTENEHSQISISVTSKVNKQS
jgi:hypothetical protein